MEVCSGKRRASRLCLLDLGSWKHLERTYIRGLWRGSGKYSMDRRSRCRRQGHQR